MLATADGDSGSFELKGKSMRSVLIVLAVAGLAACGIETAGTAATAAAAKKQEVEQAQATKGRVQRELDVANQQMAQRAAQAEEATK
jgi:ABC-type glycerol-3-phosphate transport system substrate-binding protein